MRQPYRELSIKAKDIEQAYESLRQEHGDPAVPVLWEELLDRLDITALWWTKHRDFADNLQSPDSFKVLYPDSNDKDYKTYVRQYKERLTIGISGSFVETLDSGNTECVIPKGYYDGTAAAGRIYIETESVTVTPSEDLKRQGPTTGKVITEVITNPIPEKYIKALEEHLAITGNLTGQATAGNILEGKHAYVAQENSNREMVVVKIEGTMKDYPYAVYELDALEEDPTIYLPDGFYTEAEISISSTLEQALAAI